VIDQEVMMEEMLHHDPGMQSPHRHLVARQAGQCELHPAYPSDLPGTRNRTSRCRSVLSRASWWKRFL